jgi:hypothetical protein
MNLLNLMNLLNKLKLLNFLDLLNFDILPLIQDAFSNLPILRRLVLSRNHLHSVHRLINLTSRLTAVDVHANRITVV